MLHMCGLRDGCNEDCICILLFDECELRDGCSEDRTVYCYLMNSKLMLRANSC